jgi:phenylacetate-CoA ligase
LTVELSEGVGPAGDLADRIEKRIRERLIVQTRVDAVPWGTLPRSDYKSRLVDWTGASS